MQRFILILGLALFGNCTWAQKIDTHHLNPDSTNYPNVYVKKVAEDSLQSTFAIWIKGTVQPHFHAQHTEFVEVLSGKARMTLNGKTFIIHKHDKILIPRGSVHSVTNLHHRPLKVLSIQAPKFDGDRVWIKPLTLYSGQEQ